MYFLLFSKLDVALLIITIPKIDIRITTANKKISKYFMCLFKLKDLFKLAFFLLINSTPTFYTLLNHLNLTALNFLLIYNTKLSASLPNFLIILKLNLKFIKKNKKLNCIYL